MHNSSYSIYPRYTAGSPAGVSEAVCRRVLAQEVEAIKFVLQGYQGEEKKALAISKGLEGIAIEQWEDHGIVYLRDLFTDKITKRGTVKSTNKTGSISRLTLIPQIDKFWKRLNTEKPLSGKEIVELQHLLYIIKQTLNRNSK